MNVPKLGSSFEPMEAVHAPVAVQRTCQDTAVQTDAEPQIAKVDTGIQCSPKATATNEITDMDACFDAIISQLDDESDAGSLSMRMEADGQVIKAICVRDGNLHEHAEDKWARIVLRMGQPLFHYKKTWRPLLFDFSEFRGTGTATTQEYLDFEDSLVDGIPDNMICPKCVQEHDDRWLQLEIQNLRISKSTPSTPVPSGSIPITRSPQFGISPLKSSNHINGYIRSLGNSPTQPSKLKPPSSTFVMSSTPNKSRSTSNLHKLAMMKSSAKRSHTQPMQQNPFAFQ